MAYVDSVCLKFNLYDKAPTHEQIVFNKNDDHLFLQGGASRFLSDESSINPNLITMNNNTKTKIDISHRQSLLSRMENSADYTLEQT